VLLGPQLLKSLALSDSPAGKPARDRILGADVHVDASDLQRARAVDRQDAALARLHLRGHRPANGEESDQAGSGGQQSPA